jgi:hypothetical protein
MGLAFDAIEPEIFPVALELFKSGMERYRVAGKIYKQFGKRWGVPENENDTAMIDLAISCAEESYINATGKQDIFASVDEGMISGREISIHTMSHGPDIDLDLEDITITIYNYVFSEFSMMEITCKGLLENKFIDIDMDTFDRYYEIIENINFEKLSSESKREVCDGGRFTIKITKSIPFFSVSKQTSLESPSMGKRTLETNKLLKIYEEIISLPEYKEYRKRIETKRKRLERKFYKK